MSPNPSRDELRDTLRIALPEPGWRTRFAPAPTGALHIGHLVNAIFVWGLARAYGGSVVLRMEDHDRTRCRPEYESALLDDLDWLGFIPDEGSTASYREMPTGHPFRQSDNGERYACALETLASAGRVFPCTCTRRDIAALVPHSPGEEPCYPGTCRDRPVDPGGTLARRVALEDTVESFVDLRLGRMQQRPATQCGDLLARDRHGSWTYQFAVTVDDLAQEIDVVIRGEDLLASTGRQLQLARMLGRATLPQFLHHGLIVHPDGAKLSKAAGDTSLRERREGGATPESLLGEAAHRAGLVATAAPLPVDALPSLFR